MESLRTKSGGHNLLFTDLLYYGAPVFFFLVCPSAGLLVPFCAPPGAGCNVVAPAFSSFDLLEVSGGFGGPGPLQEAGGEVGEEAGAIPVQIGRNGVEIWPKNRKLTIKKATTICM